MIPGRKHKGWNRHTIKEATGRHAVRRVCPLLLPWKTHLLGVFVIANTVFGVSIASVLFGTFCYRQRTFRHYLSWPVRISGAPCHRQYAFRRCLGFPEHYFVCFLPIVWIFSTSSIFILTSKTAAAKGCPLGVPWRYPGRGKVKRRKALRHLHLQDFTRLPKTAQKRL